MTHTAQRSTYLRKNSRPRPASVPPIPRVTPRKRMGCAPYYAVTGTHPLLPFDIIEVNYLLPPPDSILATTDHITRRAIVLQKRAEDLE